MSMQDDRGYHMEIWVLNEKEIHYHDTDLERFHDKSLEIIEDFQKENGVAREGSGEQYAQNMTIKRYTV